MNPTHTLHVLFALTLLAANVVAQSEIAETPNLIPARSLVFPTERVAGWIFVRPVGSDEESAWRKHHEAWGAVSIPAGHEIRLTVPNLDRASVGLLRRLRTNDLAELEITCREFTSAQASLIASLSELRALKISTDSAKPEALGQLVELKLLERLDIQRARIDEEGIEALSRIAGLVEIKLPRGITDRGAKAIGKIIGLERLDLFNQDAISDEGLRGLASLTQLHELVLPPRTTDEGLIYLSEMQMLARLNLTRTAITDRGLAALNGLASLECLDLSNTRVDGRGLSRLVGLKSLESLRMYGTLVDDAALARLDDLPALETLDLSHTPVTDIGLTHLADMKHIKSLDLSHTVVTSAGLGHLKRSRSVEKLFLNGTNITDDGLAHLAEMPSLRELVLPIQLSAPAVKQLKKALPNCKIPQDDRFNPTALPSAPSKSEPIS